MSKHIINVLLHSTSSYKICFGGRIIVGSWFYSVLPVFQLP